MIYNENDPFAASWLRNLIAAGHLGEGVVDESSIIDLQPAVVRDAGRVHLFAGIGGWEYALDLADWPADRPVWTGSCPCQPFSAAGKAKADEDERHLWPVFFRLVRECHPPTIFGEQVASALGRSWLARVRSDLETLDYAVGCADLCAASVGATFPRQRLFWVANSNRGQCPRINAANGQGANAGIWAAPQTLKEQPRRYAELVAMGVAQRAPAYADALRVLDGIPNRVGRLRGFGNAIVPQVAAVFIRAFLESEHEGLHGL